MIRARSRPVPELLDLGTVSAMTEQRMFQKIILLLGVLAVAQLQRMISG